ncbi:MAG: hypothetical protein WBW53_08700 [Terriglobales bacterium]
MSGASIQVIQPTGAEVALQQFVGTWHAQFKGRTFLTIHLEKQRGKLTGTVSHADFHVDSDGELTSAEEHEGSNPIVEARLTSGTLHIMIKETSQDTVQCDMKLTGTDQAELRLLAPPDVPAPKPWKLERAKGGQ